MLADFDQVFVPIFVAMSSLTVLPIYLSMTEGMEHDEARSMGRKAVATALATAVIITVAGQALFRLLDITVNDLRVGGGLILLVLSIYDLLFSTEERKSAEVADDVGVVPLGVPLIVGPATMATCLVLVDTFGRALVLASLALNLLLTFFMLENAQRLKRYLPRAVSRAFGKVMSVFMAAIAVAMMRAGIAAFLVETSG